MPSGAVQLTEQSVFTVWPEARSIVRIVVEFTLGGPPASLIAGALVEGSAAAAAKAAVSKHNATTIAVARAIEAKPRLETSRIIGLSFLVISGAAEPITHGNAPGTETTLAASTSPAPKLAISWGGLAIKLTPPRNPRQIKLW